MSDKPHSGRRRGAVRHDFNVAESTTILQKMFLNRNTYKTCYVLMSL